jgi:hypothetical protein
MPSEIRLPNDFSKPHCREFTPRGRWFAEHPGRRYRQASLAAKESTNTGLRSYSLWEIIEQVNASSTNNTENGATGMPSNPDQGAN